MRYSQGKLLMFVEAFVRLSTFHAPIFTLCAWLIDLIQCSLYPAIVYFENLYSFLVQGEYFPGKLEMPRVVKSW